MTTALYISLWAYLFCMPLSMPGQVFGWLKGVLSSLPDWAYLPIIGCPKCHAGQVAFWWQAYNLYKYGEFSPQLILIAIAGAYVLETWHFVINKWLNR